MSERQRKPWPEYERKICHVVGDNSRDLSLIYEPVPEAPSVAEVAEVLTVSAGAMGLLADKLEGSGLDELAEQYRKHIEEAKDIIARLEGA